MNNNQVKEEQYIGQIDNAALEELKSKHKNGGYHIIVGGHIGYFRNPTRQDINIAAIEQDADNPMGFFEIIMRDTQLAGSDRLSEDEELFKGAVQQVKKMVDGPKARLVKW